MSYPIIINESNHVSGATYTYRFGRSVDFGEVEVALGSASLPYSWFNVSTQLNNRTFQIGHPTTGTGNVLLTVTLEEGGYEVADINSYLRWFLISNGYFIQNNTTGEQIVYAEFRVNASTYSVEFVAYPMPTSLPSGFTAGPSITFPSTTRTPQLVVSSNNFGRLIGFAPGTFPAVQPTALTTVRSSVTPVLTEVLNVLVHLDSASNPYSNDNRVIHAISPQGVAFGRLITSEPSELSFTPQQGGFRDQITIRLTDQFNRDLVLQDLGISVKLIIRGKVSN